MHPQKTSLINRHAHRSLTGTRPHHVQDLCLDCRNLSNHPQPPMEPHATQHQKDQEILVPYTAEENAELGRRGHRAAAAAPAGRPPPREAAPDVPDAPPLPQRTPQTEAEGRAAMKAYKEAWEKANAEAANRPITQDNPAGDQEYPVLLTLASVSWYVHGHGVLPDVPLYRLESQPISGGNLNFAWRCGDRDDSSKSVFVKQAPDFIKCLGADYKLTNKRAEVEANVLRRCATSRRTTREVLVYDDYRCAMILEDLRRLPVTAG